MCCLRESTAGLWQHRACRRGSGRHYTHTRTHMISDSVGRADLNLCKQGTCPRDRPGGQIVASGPCSPEVFKGVRRSTDGSLACVHIELLWRHLITTTVTRARASYLVNEGRNDLEEGVENPRSMDYDEFRQALGVMVLRVRCLSAAAQSLRWCKRRWTALAHWSDSQDDAINKTRASTDLQNIQSGALQKLSESE